MNRNFKRLHRINNPKSIDASLIGPALTSEADQVVLQFVTESDYDPALLQNLNETCKTYGTKVNVRFYGHYGGNFDCRWLRNLPDVRSLSLDSLTNISNLHELANLPYLEEFAFGVFEADVPDLLRMSSLLGVRKLILADSRKPNIDLSPLAEYEHLEVLFLNSHARNIATLGNLTRIRKLSLCGIEKKHSLSFIKKMSGLMSLTLILGGRVSVDDLAHPSMKQLEVLRVRGLENIDLSLFPELETLKVEDQLKLRTLNLEDGLHLRWLCMFNCKMFSELENLNRAAQLKYLFLSRTSIVLDKVLSNLPNALRYLSLTGYGKRKNEEMSALIQSLGYAPAIYGRDPEEQQTGSL